MFKNAERSSSSSATYGEQNRYANQNNAWEKIAAIAIAALAVIALCSYDPPFTYVYLAGGTIIIALIILFDWKQQKMERQADDAFHFSSSHNQNVYTGQTRDIGAEAIPMYPPSSTTRPPGSFTHPPYASTNTYGNPTSHVAVGGGGKSASSPFASTSSSSTMFSGSNTMSFASNSNPAASQMHVAVGGKGKSAASSFADSNSAASSSSIGNVVVGGGIHTKKHPSSMQHVIVGDQQQ